MVAPAIVAAIIGAAGMVGSTLLSKGDKPKIKQASQQTPEQKEMATMILDAIKTGQGPLAGLFKDFDMNEFKEGVEKPALQNFQENILPMLQEKFIAGNQVGGSGAAKAIGQAGTGLQQTLANLLYQAKTQGGQQKNNNILQALGLVGAGRGPENLYQQGKPGLGPGLFEASSGLFSKGVESYLNQPKPQDTMTGMQNSIYSGSTSVGSNYIPTAGA